MALALPAKSETNFYWIGYGHTNVTLKPWTNTTDPSSLVWSNWWGWWAVDYNFGQLWQQLSNQSAHGSVNVTNYPQTNDFGPGEWFLMSSPSKQTNFVLPGNYVAKASDLTTASNAAAAAGQFAKSSGGVALTNRDILFVSDRKPGLVTNWIASTGTGTNVLGITLTNGFSGADWQNVGGAYNVMQSTDGTNWTKEFTNVPVQLAVIRSIAPLDGASGVTNVVVFTWSQPVMFQRTNSVLSQFVLADRPKLANQVSTRQWVLDWIAKMIAEQINWANIHAKTNVSLDGRAVATDARYVWTDDRSSTNYTALNLTESGVTVFQLATSNLWAHINSLSVGFGSSPVTVCVATNGLPGAPVLQWAARAYDPQWTQITNAAALTNAQWVFTLSSPPPTGYFRAMCIYGYSATVKGTLRADGVLVTSNSWSLPLPPMVHGDTLYRSSNGVPHVMWKDQTGTVRTNRLVP